MHGHAWTYNNSEITIKINIFTHRLDSGHCGGWAEEEDCPGSPDNYITII